jgi:voltage-gated potassium channel
VLKLSGQPLLILVFFNAIFIVIFGSLIYFSENQKYSVDEQYRGDFPTGVWTRQDQQHKDYEVSPYQSIPYAFWFVTVTMTTVGYGDYSPTTGFGKTLCVFIFYVGVLFLAFPISILSANFEHVYQEYQSKEGADQDGDDEEKEDIFEKKRNSVIASDLPLDKDNWLPHSGNIRRNVFLLFHEPGSSRASGLIRKFVFLAIFVSTVSFVLETVPDFQETPDKCHSDLTVSNCKPEPKAVLGVLEVVCVIIFTVDYMARIVCAHAAKPCDAGLKEDQISQRCPELQITVRYSLQLLNVIDFLAIGPFYLELALGASDALAPLRIVRLVRLFRLLKDPKAQMCADLFINVILDALPALMTLFFMTTLMCILFAACIVFAESSEYSVTKFKDSYPTGVYIRPSADGFFEEPSPFSSIPYAFWWFFVTATTVGYGDDYPTTTAGRVVGIVTFYFGLILLALPLSIVGQSFNKFFPGWMQSLEKLKKKQEQAEAMAIIEDVVPETDSFKPPADSFKPGTVAVEPENEVPEIEEVTNPEKPSSSEILREIARDDIRPPFQVEAPDGAPAEIEVIPEFGEVGAPKSAWS